MIPDFLKRENNLTKSKEPDRFGEALEAYKKHFGNCKGINTEPSTWTIDEWVDVLNECVKTDTPFDEMFDLPEDDDIDY